MTKRINAIDMFDHISTNLAVHKNRVKYVQWPKRINNYYLQLMRLYELGLHLNWQSTKQFERNESKIGQRLNETETRNWIIHSNYRTTLIDPPKVFARMICKCQKIQFPLSRNIYIANYDSDSQNTLRPVLKAIVPVFEAGSFRRTYIYGNLYVASCILYSSLFYPPQLPNYHSTIVQHHTGMCSICNEISTGHNTNGILYLFEWMFM